MRIMMRQTPLREREKMREVNRRTSACRQRAALLQRLFVGRAVPKGCGRDGG
jgi:hypothetical protein